MAALTIALFVLLSGNGWASGGGGWGYTGNEGPKQWGELGYPLCTKGHNQSPVNIPAAASVQLDTILFNYRQSPINVTNNGHTVQFNYAPGSSMTVGGKRFELLQFHFHSHSEHTVNGKPSPMEMHLVHKSGDGKLAVVGVFFEKGIKEKHSAKPSSLDLVFGAFSAVAGLNLSSETPIDAAQLLPDNQSYYHYMGSLTTPPCSEGVRWFVMQTPLQISKKQLDRFRSIFDNNARPTQPLHSRNLLGLSTDGKSGASQGGASHSTAPQGASSAAPQGGHGSGH